MYMCSDCLTSNSHLDKIADSAFVACSLILNCGCASSEKRTECTEDVMKPGNAVSAFRPNWKKRCDIFHPNVNHNKCYFQEWNLISEASTKVQINEHCRIHKAKYRTSTLRAYMHISRESTRATLQGTWKGEVRTLYPLCRRDIL